MSPRMLFIIARGDRRLHDDVRDSFRDVPEVEVMFDRRIGQRRNAAARSEAPDRRRADRRERVDLDDHLRGIGWAIARPTH